MIINHHKIMSFLIPLLLLFLGGRGDFFFKKNKHCFSNTLMLKKTSRHWRYIYISGVQLYSMISVHSIVCLPLKVNGNSLPEIKELRSRYGGVKPKAHALELRFQGFLAVVAREGVLIFSKPIYESLCNPALHS